MIIRVHARWVLPIAAPVIRDGWVDVDPTRGEIVGVGAAGAPGPVPATTIDLGHAAILPGLVNAHTHLELSHLAGRVPPASSFVAWVRAMLGVRFGAPTTMGEVVEAAATAIASAETAGTAAVGDIGNTDAAIGPLAASSLSGIHFREALGFKADDAGRIASETRLGAMTAQGRLAEEGCARVIASVAPHAPYSTSAPLIGALSPGRPVTWFMTREQPACPVSSIHLAESPEELEFLSSGTGPFRDLLTDLGSWDPDWQAPGVAPVTYLQQLGALHRDLLVVHGTQLTRPELDVLAGVGATLVLCPRSNRWVGAGVPPVADAVAAGVRLAVGTDSLSSVADLNVFAELAALRAAAPAVPAATLLRAATLGGAQALGLDHLGVLAPGASSRAVVRVPPADVEDVEEWLVADAADTSDLRWLDTLVAGVGNRQSGVDSGH
ncbi:amidohydrolase [Luteitalea sp. TBR-22]|uniref:amidohydrolase family protein n=1 Tax=Luteitalea sp. TBR-22 TaxID=2802971 RepID=UPI001AF29ADF|nr:amidohydrolase family protein [Luteitalea sp. TBR-22]BCS34130.1 amidohydrolase [Luteitalea sp. TBR-22]